MRKVLIVSINAEVIDLIEDMVAKNELPAISYYFFIQTFGEPTEKTGRISTNVYAVDDLRNRQAVEEGVSECEGWGPFDAVIATNEYTLLLAARVRERFAVAGLRDTELLKYRDKVVMKRSLDNSGVRTPQLYAVEDALGNPDLFPVVIKPRTYAGSVGVQIAKNVDELKSKLVGLRQDYSRIFEDSTEFQLEDIEIEQFINGAIFHVDGLVYQGKIIFCIPSIYMRRPVDYANGLPASSQAIGNPVKRDEWRAFVERVHRKMRFPDGAFHLEAFHTGEDRVFLEMGARPGGAYIVPSIMRAIGVNLERAHLQIQLGIEPQIPLEQNVEFGWVIFPKLVGAEEGYVSAVHVPDFSGYVKPNWCHVPEIESETAASFLSYHSNLGAFTFASDDGVLLSATLHMLMREYRVDICARPFPPAT